MSTETNSIKREARRSENLVAKAARKEFAAGCIAFRRAARAEKIEVNKLARAAK